MASFVFTDLQTTPQTLTGSQTGVLSGPEAQLIVTGNDAITTSGTSPNYLTIDGSVIVSSTISSYNAIAVGGTVVEISVGPNGYLSSSNGDTVFGELSFIFVLQNAGTIQSGEDAVQVALSGTGIATQLSNSGTIQAYSDGVVLDSQAGESRIVNTGTIIGLTGYGIYQNWVTGTNGSAFLNNSGYIFGDLGSYTALSGIGQNIIRNSGIMDGDITLDNGDDYYDGDGGQVLGIVFGDEDNDTLAGGGLTDVLDGGNGDDLLVGRGGDDDLRGNSGADRLIGGAGNDIMSGGFNDDTLTGNSGDDTMTGDNGADLLVGQDGSDEMNGGADNDTMDGGNGDDILEGGSGNDILRGRAGEDQMAGGLGFDLLTGGQDADVFVFRSTAETLVGGLRDQILDFEQGVDLIVVSGLSPGVFEFRGTAAFAPSGNPELRLFETPTGSTIVQIDNNGDGSQDAEIRVANVIGLSAEDFVL